MVSRIRKCDGGCVSHDMVVQGMSRDVVCPAPTHLEHMNPTPDQFRDLVPV
jgi:hypothetical protein